MFTNCCVLPVETRTQRRIANRDAASFLNLFFYLATILAVLNAIHAPSAFAATGSWQQLAHAAPTNVSTMLLLTDGSVMAHADQNGNGANWYRLTPDSTGSYLNGTWSTLASMNDTRLYYFSVVLKDGRVLVGGGEYGTGGSTVEVYDPATNVWTRVGSWTFGDIGDSTGKVLSDGRVLVLPRLSNFGYIYDPTADSWTTTSTKAQGEVSDEESVVIMPDGTFLSANNGTTSSVLAQKYLPGTNQWVPTPNIPVGLVDSKYEIGPGLLLYDGRALFIGANGNTAIYTSGATPAAPGSWVAGPVIPGSKVSDDAPGAVMVDGKVLFMGDVGGSSFAGPTSIFEYDPVANSMATAPNPPSGAISSPAFIFRMLALPSGQILMSGSSRILNIYTPAGTPNAAWKPTISSITSTGSGNYVLTGTQLNGLTEGAYYGDDAQMATSYPIVKIVDGSGKVFFAKSSNFSTMAVATGGASVTANFNVLGIGLASGVCSVYAIANGVASSPMSVSIIVPQPSFTAAANASIPFKTSAQSVSLSATVVNSVNEGSVSFQIMNGATNVGTAIAGVISNGNASVTYTLPAGTPAGTYTIAANYSGGTNFLASSDNSHTLTVTQATTTTLAATASTVYSLTAKSVTLSSTVTSPGGTINEGSVTFQLKNGASNVGAPLAGAVSNGNASVSYSLPAGTAAGSYTISASYSGTNFSASSDVAHNLTITQATTSTSAANASVTYSPSAQTVPLSATVSSPAGTVSEGSVTFQLTRSGVNIGTAIPGSTLNGNSSVTYTIPAGTTAGTYTINASYSGTNFSGSVNSSAVLTIGKSSASISLSSYSGTYDGTQKTVVPTTTPANLSVNFTYNGVSTAPSNVGAYAVVGTINDINYQGTATSTISISVAALTVTANPGTKVYGTANPAFTGSVAGLVAGDDIVASYTSLATMRTAIGIYNSTSPQAITPTLADPNGKLGNYAVTLIKAALSITPAPLTVTANAATKAYGANNPAFTGTLTGVVAGELIFATYSSAATAFTPAGTYDASKPEAIVPTLVDPNNELGNYSVLIKNGTLTITPATLTVTANAGTKVYGSINPAFSGTLTGLVNGDGIVDSYFSTATTVTTAGTYDSSKPEAITPVLSDPQNKLSNYTVSSTNATLTITPATLTVAADAATRVFGLINPQFTGTLTGVLGNDGISASYSSIATTRTNVGVYDANQPEAIKPALADPNHKLGNYTVNSTNGTLTITPASTVTTAVNAQAIYDVNSQSIALSASVTSAAGDVNEGTISFQIMDGTTPIGNRAIPHGFSNGTATVIYVLPGGLPLGQYTILATYESGSRFSMSSDNTHTLTIASTLGLVSAASAAPNPAGTGQTVTFNVSASGSGVSYSWDFGDGSTGQGATATHAYATAGTYSAQVTVSENSGLSVNSALQITVVAPIIGTGLDSDGDGFSDVFESGAGSDPNDPASTPVGNGFEPAAPQVPETLVLIKPKISLIFTRPLSDTIKFGGRVHIPAGFSPLNQKVVVDVGGVFKAFTLNAKGKGNAGSNTFKIRIKAAKGVVLDQSATFSVTLAKGTFAPDLLDENLTGAADVVNGKRTVVFTVLFNNTIYMISQELTYKAKKGTSGLAK